MTQRNVILIIVGVWTLGWIALLVVNWRRGKLYHRAADDENDTAKDILIRSLLYYFWWPLIILPAVYQLRYYSDVRTGKRASWLLYERGEQNARSWRLPGGEEFSGSATSVDCRLHICGYFDSGNAGRDVECRIRMLAPKNAAAGEWKKIPFLRGGLRVPTEQDEDLEDEFDRHELAIDVEEGKYEIEFRIPGLADGPTMMVQEIASRPEE